MKNKKNVLQVITLFESAKIFIGNQFVYLNDNGYNMHLICSPSDQIEDFAKKQNIKYKSIVINRTLTPWQDIKAFISICKYIKKNDIDVIIAHQLKPILLSMIAGFILRVPHKIIFSHGAVYDTMRGIKRYIIVSLNKFLSLIADKVVCVSYSVKKNRLINNIDNPVKQLVLGQGTANGVDALDKFNPENINNEMINNLKNNLSIDKNDFVIGFFGRLVKDKGIIELANAFKELIKKHQDRNIKLLIIGKLEKRGSISPETLSFLQNSNNIIFVGSVPYSEIQIYYSLLDVFVLPSYREGFPTVVLEASSMSIPVIVSKSTGCIDSIVENETGVYTDIEPNSIVGAIENFFDPIFAARIRRNSRAYILENYEHTIVRKHVLEFLNDITN